MGGRGGGRAAGALALAAAAAALAWDPLAPAAAPKRALLLGVGLVTAGLVLGGPRGATLAVPWGLAAWCALVGWTAAGLAWGPESGVTELATLAGPTAIALSALALAPAARRRALGLFAIAAAGALGVWGTVEGVVGGAAPHGGQGNPNWLGLSIAALLPIAAGAALRGTHAARRPGPGRARAAALAALGGFATLAGGGALALSSSRSAQIAVVVASASVAVARAVRWRGGPPRAGARVATGAAVAAVAAALLGATLVARGAGPRAAADGVAGALDGRLHLWRVSLHAGRDALPLGAGPGGFGHAFLEAQAAALRGLDPAAAARRFENAEAAHQAWLDAWVSGGLPGLALLAVVAALGVAGLARARAWGPLGALTAIVVASLGDSTLALPAVVLALALVLAVARGPALRVSARGAGGAALLCGAALLAPAVADLRAGRLRTRADELEPTPRLAALDAAARIAPRSGEAALAFGLALLEAREAERAVVELERSRGLLANAGTHVALGNAWTLLGERRRARREYEEGVRLSPGAFRARASLARALVEAGELPAARLELDAARLLRPGHPSVPELAELLRRAELEAEAGGAGR